MMAGLQSAMEQDPSSFVDGQNLGFVRHTFSHFSLELNVVTTSANPDGQGGWWPVKKSMELACPPSS